MGTKRHYRHQARWLCRHDSEIGKSATVMTEFQELGAGYWQGFSGMQSSLGTSITEQDD